MKIFYIANARIPTEKAHGIQIMKMCEAFVLQGVDLELVIPKRLNTIKDDSFDYYQIKRIFKIKKLWNIDLTSLNLPYIGFLIQNLTFALAVFVYLFGKKEDYIYSRDLFPLFFLSIIKKKLIHEAHFLPKHYRFYQWLFKRIKVIIVITHSLKEILIKKNINKNKILVAPDGVDIDNFQIPIDQIECRQKLNLPLDKKIILYTGHFYQWKGAQILADAAQYLDKQCIVIFVGGTDKNIAEFKEKNRHQKNILIIGHRPHQEIPYWLKAADVLVLPNSRKSDISRLYTSPLKMFEYMAAKRPIIASNLTSVGEILNFQNAILVKPDNAQSLSDGIKNVIDNHNLSFNLSEQAYRDVQKYSWARRARKIKSFIKI